MGKMKKKFNSGEASIYMTRKQALLKLQLSLKMFRKLCILKGIYPREPKNRKRAQKGSTEKKTLYLKKDIQFLLHEPIVDNLRQYKIYLRRKSRAMALRDKEGLKRITEHKPVYSLDHIVKERYPTFIDAVRDLDDALTLTCIFSTFPSIFFARPEATQLCRRLTTEFFHYVIEARALRKVFVSTKGYYFQADILGQPVVWIMSHNFGFQPQSKDDVDFRIMATFVEFYSALLGFVNFRLYNTINVCYPPKLRPPGLVAQDDGRSLINSEDGLQSERVAALNQCLLRTADEDENADTVPEMDEFPNVDTTNSEKMEELKQEENRVNRVKKLFDGYRFFLNREVPREPLTLAIRSCGGQVSWDTLLFPGATYQESDDSITHQIVDREMAKSDKKFLSRFYVQPQWVFDSLNIGKILPVANYFIGAVLPPHVSPFLTEKDGDYIPPEKRQFFSMEDGIVAQTTPFKPNEKTTNDVDEEEESIDEGEDDIEEEDEPVPDNPKEVERKKQMKKMSVKPGRPEKSDPVKQQADESKEEYALRVMMIKNSHKRVYKRMMDKRKHWKKEASKLANKRKSLDAEAK